MEVSSSVNEPGTKGYVRCMKASAAKRCPLMEVSSSVNEDSRLNFM